MAFRRPSHSGGAAVDEPRTHHKHGEEDPEPEPKDEPGDEPAEPRDAPPEPAQQAAPAGLLDLQDPNAIQGTRYSGPVLCGAPDGPGIPGTALYCKRARITVANGSFNIAVPFPPGAILLQMWTAIETPSDATTATVELDQASGGTIMHAAAIDLKGAAGISTTAITKMLLNTWTAWLKVAVTGSPTVGAANVIVLYSLPAKSAQS